jgi:putative transposase
LTKNKFTEEQVVRLLQEAESGAKSVTDLCREYKITKNTFYVWKKKYGGMSTQEARRLKELERENARLKKLLAERDLEIDAMKELASKNSWGPLPGARGQGC